MSNKDEGNSYMGTYLKNSYSIPRNSEIYKASMINKNKRLSNKDQYAEKQNANLNLTNQYGIKDPFTFSDDIQGQISVKSNNEKAAIITPGVSRNNVTLYKTDQKEHQHNFHNPTLSKETEKLLIASRKRMQKVRSKLDLKTCSRGNAVVFELWIVTERKV